MAEAQRRLTTIVAADIAGFSRLVGADEEGTLAAQRRHRDELIQPLLDEYHGRIANTAGDSFLFEFPSAVEAVRCALAVQDGMVARNNDVPAESRIEYRIGINVGDVLADGDDLLGDGVNVAARLETLADPGGICISNSAYEQVRDRLDIAFEDMGEVEVKNIARAVRVFRVLAEGETAVAAAQVPDGTDWRKWAGIAAVILVLVACGGGLWWWQKPDFAKADPAKMAYALPDKPSIAVLPFKYLGPDADEHSYLAEGLSANIVTSLGHLSGLLVIDWDSTRKLKERSPEVRAVAERFGVQYVLSGSVQTSGKELRVTAQLADATSGRLIWSKSFEGTQKQIFEIQDNISKDIIVAMAVKLLVGEEASTDAATTKSLKAWKLLVQAVEQRRRYTKEGLDNAMNLMKQAEAVDPNFAAAMVSRAGLHVIIARLSLALNLGVDPAASMAKAMEIADAAVEKFPNYVTATMVQGWLDLWRGEHERAIDRLENVAKSHPSNAYSHWFLATAYTYSGRPEDALVSLARADRIRAQFRSSTSHQQLIAMVDAGQYAKALRHLDDTKDKYRLTAIRHVYRALALAGLGRNAEAKKHVASAKEKKPNWSSRTQFVQFNHPYANDWAFRTYAPILAKLGLPEYPPATKPQKPAIAVLPFANLSDDKAQEYFADGITDDLITDLSKISGLIVIARNSVFTYKGRAVKVQEVAKDLDVSHVLEGSIRRAGDKVRINAQLIDAKTGAHLWAETFDRAYGDIFQLQDEIASKIVGALEITLTAAEKIRLAGKPTDNLEAYEKYLQARKAHFRFDDDGMMRALRLYAEAIELDPTFAAAYAGDASLTDKLMRGGQKRQFLGYLAARERSERSFKQALKLDPNNNEAIAVQANNYLIFKTREEAIAVARKAVLDNANDALSHRTLAMALAADSRNAEARREIDTALRLDPKLSATSAGATGWIYYAIGDYEQAVKYYKIMAERLPYLATGHSGLAMSYAQLGRMAEAKAAMDNRLKVSRRSNLRLVSIWGRHMKKEVLDHLLDGLRKAGMPEWAYGFRPEPGNRLSGAEIKATILGRRVKGRSGSGLAWEQTTSSSGDWVIKNPYFTINGHYRVVGDELCSRSDAWLFGRENCFPVYRNPTGSRAALNEYIFASAISVMRFSIVE